MARLVVAVTGGIASGKSLADAAFGALGVVVVDADVIARELVAPGQAALSEIADEFGSGFLRSDGSLDRVAMRAHVFSSPIERRRLEAIMHPRIRSVLQQRCASALGLYVVASVPLLAEAGALEAYDWVGRVLVVDAPVAEQRRRLVARDGITVELADQIIESQVTRERRLEIASDVIINDHEIHSVASAVEALDVRFRRLANE